MDSRKTLSTLSKHLENWKCPRKCVYNVALHTPAETEMVCTRLNMGFRVYPIPQHFLIRTWPDHTFPNTRVVRRRNSISKGRWIRTWDKSLQSSWKTSRSRIYSQRKSRSFSGGGNLAGTWYQRTEKTPRKKIEPILQRKPSTSPRKLKTFRRAIQCFAKCVPRLIKKVETERIGQFLKIKWKQKTKFRILPKWMKWFQKHHVQRISLNTEKV